MRQGELQTIWLALADALIPPGGPLPGAEETASGRRSAELVAVLPPVQRRLLEGLLWLLEHLPRLWGPRFSQRTRPQREAILARIEGLSPAAARALLPLKLLAMAGFLEQPEVEKRLRLDDVPLLPLTAPLPAILPLPVQRPEELEGLDATFDVVIVGSGAGGAPMARTLARAGWSVALVEEGDAYSREDFRGSALDRMRLLYRDAGSTVTLGRPMVLLPLGRAVGGTTVVNSGTCFRTPDALVDGWHDRLGIDLSAESLLRHYDEVERTLGVAPVPWEVMGENGLLAHRGASALGIAGRPLLRNAEGCRGSGQCAAGCPVDAKRGVHLNYLPQASAAGAEIFARCRVDAVDFDGDRASGVHGRFVAQDGSLGGTFRLKARRGVVVTAGAIGTPDLLRRSGVRAPGLGRHLRIHPGTGVTGLFAHEVTAWRGVLQSYLIDALQDDGILLEATFPPPTMGYAEAGMTLTSAERKTMLGRFGHLATLGLLVSDTSSGRLFPAGGDRTPLLWYWLNDHDRVRVLRGMELASRILLAAGAQEVVPMLEGAGPLRSLAEVQRCFAREWPASALQLSAYHPMGTAAMGPAETAVVDGFGQVHGKKRLCVADASVFPASLGVNPQVTIMAFSSRAAEHILEAW